MKNLIAVLFFVPLISIGQMRCYVSLKEGLSVYETPDLNSRITATILYGQNLTIESRTGKKLIINHIDKETEISKGVVGEWVEIEYYKSFLTEQGDGEITSDPLRKQKYTGYVFDGFLKEAFFPQYVKENYVNLDSMDQIGSFNCYKFKSGVPFTGVAYDVVFFDELFKIELAYGNSSPKYINGPVVNIYVAEFKNGVLTGKIKRINPLEETVKESTKIIDLKKIGIEKEIVIRYKKVNIEYGDLQEYIQVEGTTFFEIGGDSIGDFSPFNFWVDNREDFLFNGYENKFLKITYFSEYTQSKGQYGYEYNLRPIHFFDQDCNLYETIKKVEVIEDFKIKK